MQRTMLLAKIHRAVVSEAALDYEGSLTIPPEVMDASGILPHEKIMVATVSNGARFWTYAIPGTERGRFCLNGATARLGSPGDRIIVFAFAQVDAEEAAEHRPRIVVMDESNRIVKVEGPSA